MRLRSLNRSHGQLALLIANLSTSVADNIPSMATRKCRFWLSPDKLIFSYDCKVHVQYVYVSPLFAKIIAVLTKHQWCMNSRVFVAETCYLFYRYSSRCLFGDAFVWILLDLGWTLIASPSRQFSFRHSLPTNKQITVFLLKFHTHGSCNNLFTESDRRSRAAAMQNERNVIFKHKYDEWKCIQRDTEPNLCLQNSSPL